MSKKSRPSLKSGVTRFLLVFGIVMLFSAKLWIQFKVDLLMRDIRTLEVQRNRLLSEREQMNAMVKRLQNIDRISKLAREKLSLVEDPEPVYTIRLEDFNRVQKLKASFAKRQSRQKEAYRLAGIK